MNLKILALAIPNIISNITVPLVGMSIWPSSATWGSIR